MSPKSQSDAVHVLGSISTAGLRFAVAKGLKCFFTLVRPLCVCLSVRVSELTSRYSKVCCEVMARSRCPQVLYDLIRGLNRSPPHQKILK